MAEFISIVVVQRNWKKTEAELRTPVKQGTLNKSPGEDGICHEFYLVYWETIKCDLLQMFNSELLKGRLGTSHPEKRNAEK
jgi:hypothetical protein